MNTLVTPLSRRILNLLALIVLSCLPARSAPTAEEILKILPGQSGLVVTVGVGDATLATELARTGRVLVHSLVGDRATRDKMRATICRAGQYGVASVEMAAGTALPFADNMVNVAIFESEAPGLAPLSKDEALRKLAPGGTAFIGQAGKWSTVEKPTDPTMGTWPQQNGNASNNPVSDDEQVQPVSTVRFIDGVGNGATKMGGTAGLPVVGGGVIVSDDPFGYVSERGGKAKSSMRLVCRDAHSGLVKWSKQVDLPRCFLAIDGNFLVSTYPLPGDNGVVHILDLFTGKVLHSLEIEGENSSTRTWAVHGVVRNGMAWLSVGDELLAWELTSGKVLWRKKAEGFETFFSPSLTPDGKRLVVVESANRRTGLNARWPWATIHSLTAVDPATGRELWRNDELRGDVTLHVPVTDEVGFFAAPWGIGSHYEKVARDNRGKLPRNQGTFEVTTGKVLWKKDASSDGGASGSLWSQVSFFHGDEVFLCQPDQFVAWNAKTGALTRKITTPTTNQRCIRTRASEKYLITGFGSFLDFETGKFTDQNISRSACAIGPTPGYGSIYSGPNGCRCFAQVRGFGAFAAASAPVILSDAARLETLNLPAEAGGAVVPVAKVEEVRVKEGLTFRVMQYTAQPVRDSWSNNEELPFPETEPVTAGDLELVAVVSEHRLEARRAGRVVWAMTADARISVPPLVQDGRVFTSSHDGYVYACDLATGKLLWRALVAPNHREMMAFGQLESAWPVRRLAFFEGAVCASAGRHPELDGGIHLAGLDPATGKARWREVVAFDSAGEWIDVGKKKKDMHINGVTNGGLVVEDGKLILTALDPVHGGGNKGFKSTPMAITPGKN